MIVNSSIDSSDRRLCLDEQKSRIVREVGYGRGFDKRRKRLLGKKTRSR